MGPEQDNEWFNRISAVQSDPAALETLYREAAASGEQARFEQALKLLLQADEPGQLLQAWGYRLNLIDSGFAGSSFDERQGQPGAALPQSGVNWGFAIGLSVVLGLVWVWFVGNHPPIPVPTPGNPSVFWFGWSLVTAAAILAYLYLAGSSKFRHRHRRAVVMVAVGLALLWVLLFWFLRSGYEDYPILVSIHLPLAALSAVGYVVTAASEQPVRDRFAFLIKSADTVATAVIYVLVTGLAVGLTVGIFEVIDVSFPPGRFNQLVTFSLGFIPVLAVASVYIPSARPHEQDLIQGPIRLLRLFSRVALSLVNVVLAVYILWFLPQSFWQPFQDRDLLIIYNLTVAAVLVLMTIALPGPGERLPAPWLKRLRIGLVMTASLTLLLNAYGFVAVVSRVWDRFGLTMNRHAVIGWNGVTLLILGYVIYGQIRAWRSDVEAAGGVDEDGEGWIRQFQTSLVKFLPLIALWSLWVLLVSPWIPTVF